MSLLDDLIVPCTSSLVSPPQHNRPFAEYMPSQEGIIWMIDPYQKGGVTIWSRSLGKVEHEVSARQRRLLQSSLAVGSWVMFDARYIGQGEYGEWRSEKDLRPIQPKLKFVRYQASDFDVTGVEALVVAVFESYAYLWSDVIGRVKVTNADVVRQCRPATAVLFDAKRYIAEVDSENDIAFEAFRITSYPSGLAFTDVFATSTLKATREKPDHQNYLRFTLNAREIRAKPADCDPGGFLRASSHNEQDLFIIYAPALVSDLPATHRALLIGKLESAPFEFTDGIPIEIEPVVEDLKNEQSDEEDFRELAAASSSSDRRSIPDADESTETDREIARILARVEENREYKTPSLWSPPADNKTTDESSKIIPDTMLINLTVSDPIQQNDNAVSSIPSTTTFTTASESLVDWGQELESVEDSDLETQRTKIAPLTLPTLAPPIPLNRKKTPSESKMSHSLRENEEDEDDTLVESVAHVQQQWEQKMLRFVKKEDRPSPASSTPASEYRDTWMVTGPLPLTNLLGVVLSDAAISKSVLECAGIEIIMAAVDCLTNELDYDTLYALARPDFHDGYEDFSHLPQGRNTCTVGTQTLPRAELSIFRRLLMVDGFIDMIRARHSELFHFIQLYEPALEVCCEATTGIVTCVNRANGTGIIWSPSVEDVFIPPPLFDPQLQLGNWVVFSAEYYDKDGERRTRVTEYEVLPEVCLPVRIRENYLLVKTTIAFAADCESHGDTVVGWSPDFNRVIGYRPKLAELGLQFNTLYNVWVSKAKPTFGKIQWRLDYKVTPTISNDQTPLKNSPWQIDNPTEQASSESSSPSKSAQSAAPNDLFRDVESVVTSIRPEKQLAFAWASKLGNVLIGQSCSFGLQLGDWISLTVTQSNSAAPGKCPYFALNYRKITVPCLPTRVERHTILLKTKVRLPSSLTPDTIIAKSAEVGDVLVYKRNIGKQEPNETIDAWVKKIPRTEEIEWKLDRVDDDVLSNPLSPPISRSSSSRCDVQAAANTLVPEEALATSSRPTSAATVTSPVEDRCTSRASTQASNSSGSGGKKAPNSCQARQLLQRIFSNETLRSLVLTKDINLLTELCQYLASDDC